jgi:multiple sugar transport system permease protein
MIKKKRIISPELLFVLPWIMTFVTFWLYPIVYSFLISFTDRSLIEPDKTDWIGIQNYVQLFHDPVFHLSIKNTFLFCAVSIPITTSLAILVANAVHHSTRLQPFFRMSLFLPSVVSITVMSLIFIQFYAQDGYLNMLARFAGIDHKGLLLSERTALFGIIAMDIFIGTGYFAILFIAAIKNIPVDLFESADLSGASKWQKFRFITLPLLRPMILFSVVIGTIKGLQVFTEIYLMTKGGPLHSTTTVIYFIYELAFKDFSMGYASAAAYILLILTGFITWIQFKLFKTT